MAMAIRDGDKVIGDDTIKDGVMVRDGDKIS
jgi:hypothetical protein